MKEYRRNRFLPLFMALIMVMACCLNCFIVSAKSGGIEAAESFSVYLIQNGEKQLLHEYTLEEMQDLSDGSEVYYSSLDQLPTTVLTLASGVYFSDLFDDLSNYSDASLKDFTKLKFLSSDHWTRSYSSYESLTQTRYYYEGLFQEGVVEGGKIVGDIGSPTAVKPMLAIWSWQERVPVDAQVWDTSIDYSGKCERFRLCMGMSQSEVDNDITTSSEFGRGIYAIEITLPDDKQANVPVEGIAISKSSAELKVGERLQLSSSVQPGTATNTAVEWASSNTLIATVNSSGLVTAIKSGTATITASSRDGNDSKSCRVVVGKEETKADEIAVKGVSLNRSKAAIAVDGQLQLSATVSPSNATNDGVSWSSSKESVVTVNSSGKIIAHKEGAATITVTTDDGDYSDTCQITVQDSQVDVTSISLQPTSLSLEIGAGHQLIATLTPQDCSNDNVSWSSSNQEIATVSASGYVTAKAAGTAQINAISQDGGFIAPCQITVGSPNPVSFSDVNESHWFYSYVTSLAQIKIVNGYPDGSFRPDASVSYGEALKLILLAADIQPNTPGGHWADSYLSRAIELGVLDAKVDLDAAINRLNMAEIAAKAMKLNLGNNISAFTDINHACVNALYTAKIVEGSFDEGEHRVFRPNETIKRSEISTIVFRMNQVIQ